MRRRASPQCFSRKLFGGEIDIRVVRGWRWEQTDSDFRSFRAVISAKCEGPARLATRFQFELAETSRSLGMPSSQGPLCPEPPASKSNLPGSPTQRTKLPSSTPPAAVGCRLPVEASLPSRCTILIWFMCYSTICRLLHSSGSLSSQSYRPA